MLCVLGRGRGEEGGSALRVCVHTYVRACTRFVFFVFFAAGGSFCESLYIYEYTHSYTHGVQFLFYFILYNLVLSRFFSSPFFFASYCLSLYHIVILYASCIFFFL